MEKMTDMKISRADKKAAIPSPSRPDYPWGLELNLDSAALDKMGMKDMPEVGMECMIHAMGKVTRVSESASARSKDRSLSVQITKMHMEHDEDGHKAMERGYKRGKGPKAGM